MTLYDSHVKLIDTGHVKLIHEIFNLFVEHFGIQ